MKITKTVLACLAVLAFFALTTRSARAGDVDCTTSVTTCFGSTVAGTASGTLTGGTHAATFNETVYKSGSVYTYVFSFTNSGSSLDYASAFTSEVSGSTDNFNCGNGSCLNYGVVIPMSSVNDTGFTFNSLSMTVNFSTLASGGNFTFYVQSTMGPTNGGFLVGNGGPSATANALGAPEPNVLTLLGSLLLVLMLGMPFASGLRTRTA